MLPFIATLPSLSGAAGFTYTITAQGTYTGNFNSSVDIGVADASRVVFVAVGLVVNGDRQFSMTLNGDAMLVNGTSYWDPNVALGHIAIASGTTATLGINISFTSPLAIRYVVIAFYGLTATPVQYKTAAASGSSMSTVINTQDNGLVVAVGVCEYGNSITWTGVTGIYSAALTPYSGVTGRMDIGVYIPTIAQVNRNIQLVQNISGGGRDKVLAVQSIT